MRRFSLIAVLLVCSLLLVGVLTFQAHYAVRSHRNTAESVLRDYAALASGEFVRRTVTEVGYYGYYPLITALRGRLADRPDEPLPQPADLAVDERTSRAAELGVYTFRFDPASPTPSGLETSGEIGPEIRDLLTARLAAALDEGVPTDGSYVTSFVEVRDEIRSFVFMPAAAGEGSPLIGFEVKLSELSSWIDSAIERGPLLPPSLAKHEFTNDSIFIEVNLSNGERLYRRGEPYDPWFGVEKPFGDEYRGALEALTVRLAVNPEVAPQLVIGGLPRSRLPLLLSILAVVAGLFLIAILQLRRERALVRLRSDFVSRVSHELRTPLTQIRMFAETLLLGRMKKEDERRRALAIIDRESRRLSHLVENVLQFSRSERETIQLAPRPRQLEPLLSELVDEFNPLLDGDRVRVVTRLEESCRVRVDEDAMRQIVLNLLENAVKYGPADQEVRLGASRENGRVRMWVDDEGPGIRPADRERIWRPFQRVDPDPRSAQTGTGIGLSVVRELVVLHGGRSWVEEGERGGARFVVELPAAGVNGAEDAE